MAQQYWVGEFFIDLSRNQISQLGESQTLPPKALLVLTHLAKNRGKVVSYEELLDSVWPNSVVTPNTLQRCIAQLRKALGENSKSQGIIKTHAKQGYSLEVDVNWSQDEMTGPTDTVKVTSPLIIKSDIQDPNSIDLLNHSANSSTQKSLTSHKRPFLSKKVLSTVTLALLIIFTFMIFKSTHNKPHFKVTEVRYLTATDDKEYGATYSPDGNYILFHRYYNRFCVNDLWAKNAHTLEEVKLTAERASYSGHSLSSDGKTLAFIKQEDCSKPINQKQCYRLMSINFQQGLVSPQEPRELLHCQNSKIRNPKWIGENHIAMLQNEDQHWRLIVFSVIDKSSSIIFQPEEGNITYFDFSIEHQRFAVTTRKLDGQQSLHILSIDGQSKSNNLIDIPTNMPRHITIKPRFIPHTDKLIFGDGSNLYTLTTDGEITKEDVNFKENAGGPYFHPDGKKMLLINGRYDSDIARLPITVNPSNNALITKDLSIFQRSIHGEDYAKTQPNGASIAFASEKTGTMQIWLEGDQKLTKLTDFPKGTFIDNLYWNRQGTTLLVQVNLELIKIGIDGSEVKYNFPYPVKNLYHWDNDTHHAIANISVNGVLQFVTIDLKNMTYHRINEKRIKWADTTSDGTLIFIDHMDRFWIKGPVEDQLISALTDQGSTKRFLLAPNKHQGVHKSIVTDRIYGINKANQLWSYDLDSKVFTILRTVPSNIDYITDIKNGELFVTVVIGAKKEVIELSMQNAPY